MESGLRLIRAAVLTVSDRSARGERPDAGGPAVAEAAARLGWRVVSKAVVADDRSVIAGQLKAWCDGPEAPGLVLTTGGTGLGPRDVTPEATREVLEREAPGFSERMRREGERSTPLAALSRGVCGTRGSTLIVNLPGSPRGAVESLESVSGLIGHALAVMGGEDHRP
ncbi:MAG: MogA/MoaB family molybdenum cofactor biosynthesis protein [Elusimicrobia bacterium]|nr:MogA/MoaB family molybdenum cofactor biosynthesis protein [Elusimicrobiota bacterium]